MKKKIIEETEVENYKKASKIEKIKTKRRLKRRNKYKKKVLENIQQAGMIDSVQ